MEHTFEPTTYHNNFGSYDPILRITSGDLVSTSTADAFGSGREGDLVAKPGNPLTGPFFVEGAEPGDELVVLIEGIVPNRDHGYTMSGVAPHIVDGDFVNELPTRSKVRWAVDSSNGTATLNDQLAEPATLTVALAPMLGCIGVAPVAGQAISTATSGRYGGNMDYRAVTAGVSISFPVFTPGALFFVGDGHAAQGDGEIVGTGIEISMDVSFRVELRKNAELRWPRMKTETHIIALGNARPVDQALQHATTELIRWLCSDYGYDTRGASHLLGQALEYDIGNVFDPAYTVAAKIAKEHLPD
jgi:acetamidase/formamidase